MNTEELAKKAATEFLEHVRSATNDDVNLVLELQDFLDYIGQEVVFQVMGGGKETQGYAPDQTPMSVSPDWKADGTGFKSTSGVIDTK